jgi:hypothetical protein
MTSLGSVRGSTTINVQQVSRKTPDDNTTTVESTSQQVLSVVIFFCLVGAGITVGIWAAVTETEQLSNSTVR